VSGLKRVTAALALVVAAASTAQAQNYGVPMFTNPSFGSGVRIHADAGRPSKNLNSVSLTTVQAGLSFAVGPVGLGVFAAGNFNDIKGCTSGGAISCSNTYFSGAAQAQLRVMGGGRNPLSLSLFGGAGTDFSSYEVAANVNAPHLLSIPVGGALGYKLGPLSLWGAPRYNLYKWVSCGSSGCPDASKGTFRYAVGVNLPLGPLGLRAAYDGGKLFGENIGFFGVGVSLGLGSQQ